MAQKIGPTLGTRMAIFHGKPSMHEFILHLFDGVQVTIYGYTFSRACRENDLNPAEIHQNIHAWSFDGRPQDGRLPELDNEEVSA